MQEFNQSHQEVNPGVESVILAPATEGYNKFEEALVKTAGLGEVNAEKHSIEMPNNCDRVTNFKTKPDQEEIDRVIFEKEAVNYIHGIGYNVTETREHRLS